VAGPQRRRQDSNAYDEVAETGEQAGTSNHRSHRPTLAAGGARNPALMSDSMELRCSQEDA
jgi:hypothetical protein